MIDFKARFMLWHNTEVTLNHYLPGPTSAEQKLQWTSTNILKNSDREKWIKNKYRLKTVKQWAWHEFYDRVERREARALL